MNKKLIAILTMAACVTLMNACNSGTSTTETKDTATMTADTSSMTSTPKDEGMLPAMTAMSDKISAMKMSGDIDNDFAAIMIEHHQGAVDISQMEADKGTDSSMVMMAKTMITDHKAEIEQLKNFQTEHAAMHKDTSKTHLHEPAKENELESALKMETGKIKDVKTTGNPDKDYAMLMQAHHEDAISMSKAEVAQGDHAELKKMAQKMMADDGKEVKMFKDYLSAHP